jgi:hypothetical protein
MAGLQQENQPAQQHEKEETFITKIKLIAPRHSCPGNTKSFKKKKKPNPPSSRKALCLQRLRGK